MNISIEFGRKKRSKAETIKPKLDQQAGSAVREMELLMQRYGIKSRTYTAEDFEKMRQSDGTFMAINNLLTLPILACHWDIEADEENDPDGVQAQLVRDAFTLPPERGGMSTPFHLVLAEMLRALSEGYRYFEKVYTLNPDGKIVYRKLAGYDANTITIRTDEKGGFDGVDQRLELGGDVVHIPVEKSFLFTNAKERNWLKGESMFVAAAYHYKEKHDLYYFGKLQAQAGTIPGRVAIASENAPQDSMDAVAERLADMVELNSAVVLPFGYNISNLGSVAKVDIQPLINHHNMEMTRSVLAHAIMLGDGASGSWALSKDQTDLLNLVLTGIMRNIEYHINSYLIPDLTELNFVHPTYPQFKFAALTDATVGILESVFTQIISSKPEKLSDEFITGIIEKMALQLGINLEEVDAVNAGLSRSKHQHGSTGCGEGRCFLGTAAAEEEKKWRRDLTEAEKRVNLDGLEKKMDTMESTLDEKVAAFYDQLANVAEKAIRPLLDDGKADEALEYRFDDQQRTHYREMLRANISDGFNYGKTGAANELGEEAPATSKDARAIIDSKADDYVNQQLSELETQIHAIIASNARRANLARTQLSVQDTIEAILEAIGLYFTKHAKPGNSLLVSDSINIGRAATFTEYADKIDRYEWSAILDEKTCATCLALDSKVVSPEEYRTTKWQPPVHFMCRCIWVAIRTVEEEKPAITGLPTQPGGMLAPGIA